ncbi:hypothetical protein Vadar_003744 [Vaccinium darrowii]|uniref:Uncharacterized protein n=1 Tax=Vaccinium darrowii TaxID=229202 RepID=A0ACB7XFI4_9ERIC|nr:hypothetical protein Vadar_003744 [Vaccinium darrowii]
MRVLSWNIRGLGSRVKKRFLIKIIKDRRPDITFIQESKLEQVELSDYQRFWGNLGVAGVFSKSDGASGGLISMWNTDIFRLEQSIIHKHFILIKGYLFNDFHCVLVNIYAPNDTSSRRRLWEEILLIKQSCHLP